MSRFSRGVSAAMQNAPKPAWIRWPGQRTFCCFFTIRTGASIIGWFNFIFNSLYVGMLVFALAHTKAKLGVYFTYLKELEEFSYDDCNNDTSNISSSGDFPIPPQIIFPTPPPFVLPWTECKNGFTGEITENSCTCGQTEKYIFNTTRDCPSIPSGFKPSECLIQLEYISSGIMPFMYKSCAIPGVMVAMSVLWLTAVESRSIRYLRLIGFIFIVAIPIQIIAQLCCQIYANVEFKRGNVGSLHSIVWVVYGIYSVLNIYFFPILCKYIKLRTKESAQGIEQGLLTSERCPPSNEALNVYLEDAFSIDEIHNNRIRYTIDDDDDDEEYTQVEYNHRSSHEDLSSSHLPI